MVSVVVSVRCGSCLKGLSLLQALARGEEDAAISPSAVQLCLAIRHQRIHVGEIDRKPGVISSAACAATHSSCQHPPRVCGWRRLTGVLSVRGCEWVVCDRGRSVLPPLPANLAPPGYAEQGGSSSHPRLPSGEALHPAVPADVGVSFVPWCLYQALHRVGTLLLPPLQPGSFWVLGVVSSHLFSRHWGGERRIWGLFRDLGERLGRA